MNTQPENVRVGFVGTGKMATALAKGLITSGFSRAEDVTGTDIAPAAMQAFAAATGAGTIATPAEMLPRCDVLVLATKPQHMAAVLESIREQVTAEHLVVSIAAGVPLSTMLSALGETTRVVRVMPNTPALVGAGAAGYALGGGATESDSTLIEQMLSTVGLAIPVAESHLDAVTGLSGSGPAYGFQIIEALSDGGVRMGLPRDVATRLAAQTLLGAARMVLETGEHPGALKDAVTSPGGTTIAGLHALERGALRAALMNAVEAATVRSCELGTD